MKNQKQPTYQLFYSELPVNELTVTEYPKDIHIIHAYDKPRNPVLSQDQLNQLATELLEEAKKEFPASAPDTASSPE